MMPFILKADMADRFEKDGFLTVRGLLHLEEADLLIKRELLPDGRTKLILRYKETGAISEKVI